VLRRKRFSIIRKTTGLENFYNKSCNTSPDKTVENPIDPVAIRLKPQMML